MNYELKPIGFIQSKIKSPNNAPHFYTEGAPEATIELLPEYIKGLYRMKAGDEIVIITWLHQADRSLLQVHPKGNKSNPLTGVFLTRSPHRPNPLGLHRARILEITSTHIHINAIEAIDKTPVIDIKVAMNTNDN